MKRAVRNWENLVAEAKAPLVQSGILELSIRIFGRLAKLAEVPIGELVEYVTGNSEAWDCSEAAAHTLAISVADWDRDLASLDSAILALVDAGIEDAELADSLDTSLTGSLFARQLERYEEAAQKLIRKFITARAARIWEQTTEPQRRGYHAAGIGLTAGNCLDTNMDRLVELLSTAEAAITAADADKASAAIVAFAELVFQIAPFRAPRGLPPTWKEAVLAWMLGQSSAEVIRICGGDGVDFLQEALTYRLPWAMESVRVHANAVSSAGADSINGWAALAVEAGSCDKSVIVTLRSGLNSREAAFAAISSTWAVFEDRAGLREWLASDEVEALSFDEAWPTPQSRHAWLQFYEGENTSDFREWRRVRQRLGVSWFGEPPGADESVILEPSNEGWLVLKPSFELLGRLTEQMTRPRRDVVRATVDDRPDAIVVEWFGPLER